ncbi:tRNA pseudouridine(38-40) synthase TruA [Oceanisphaera psychrotolerans]|uniref:tRNA pseudouridine synthase A n=1 Tax=Oceanisphaera psychrotolerans TaxID=1414654 RepID=A0A1J4QGX4_9GAMM|nr:tRNA pseudouridine(38-40) synthase TruA [Oceanisphaera psychrotolerans]OIN13161.1 tRNA pseudouridine(38-40) synthase TruA [Oceanisphaera psychrotolerans]
MRIALGIEYDGSGYYGWQRQREVPSIQAEVEKALSKIADHPVDVQCAGRTDAGVHGTGQVVHFDTHADRPPGAWTLGMNANLPPGIAVRWVKTMNDDFHARFSATARRYRYIIFNHNMRPAIHGSGVSHYVGEIDAQKMHEAGQCLLGERDFSAFRAVQCQSRSPNRNIMHLNVQRYGHYVVLDIKANAFLHHMVRNITGTLLMVGMGQADAGWVKEILEGRDRNLAGPTAKAGGLYLVEVDYPAELGLPVSVPGPLWLPDQLR